MSKSDFQILEQAAEDDSVDNHRNAPRPDPACLYGLVGDVARAGSATTEANPYAVAANFMAFMGCAVGRNPHMTVGDTLHHAVQFILHVGRSGRGRKGDAASLVRRIERALQVLSPESVPKVHRGGLSTREGLVFLIHDGYRDGKTEVPPELDKRLLVIESEFANVLHQGKRDGNTLSSALRDCWDSVSMRPATKSNRLWATDPHVCLSAAVTPTELTGVIDARELTNGFANRFLMLWAERLRMVPFPVATPQAEVDALAARVLEVLEFCGAARWEEKDQLHVQFSPAAQAHYEVLYRGELNSNDAGPKITALIERRAPMLLRIAMLFAVCDLTTTVEVHHLDAALGWVRYSVDTAKFVFGSAAAEQEAAETSDTAETLLSFLAQRPEATRWQLSRDCFKGHKTKAILDAAIQELLSANPPGIVVESIPRPKGTPGTPTKIYRLAAKSAKSAKTEHPCGLAADSAVGTVSEECEVSAQQDTTLRTLSTLREATEPPQSRASVDTLHTSHTSPVNTDTAVIDVTQEDF